MKALLSLLWIGWVCSSSAFAGVMTCADLKKAYENDQITEGEYVCNGEVCSNRRLEQLRATVIHFGHDDISGDPSEETLERLEALYDPKYSVITVGSQRFEAIDISLGDNPFQLLFIAGTLRESGLASNDGSIEAAGEYCQDVEFSPVVSQRRRVNLCKKIVPKVQAKRPDSKFDVVACSGKKKGSSFTALDHTRSWVSFDVRRNLQEFGGGYFVCSARMDRKTDLVRQLKCEVQ